MPLISRSGRALLTLASARSDHLAALRVAVSVAMPSLALLAAGRPDLIIYAVFGAFTGMYGRDEPHQLRLIHQAQAAAVLVAGTTIGIGLTAMAATSWALVAAEAALAAVGSAIADRIRLKPAGPFFGIFALGACASVPAAVPWWWAALICLGSAGFSILIGFAGWFRTRIWRPGSLRLRPTHSKTASSVASTVFSVPSPESGQQHWSCYPTPPPPPWPSS